MNKFTERVVKDETILRHNISIGSHDPDDYVDLAHLVADALRYDEAIDLYETALSLVSTAIERAKVSADLGWVLLEADQPLRAKEFAEQAVLIVTNEQTAPQVLFIKGSSQALLAQCAWSKNPDQAAEFARLALDSLRQLMQEDPAFDGLAVVYCLAARVQLLLGNARDAIDLSGKCLELTLSDRDRQTCLSVSAEALKRENRLDEAQKALKETVRYARSDKKALVQIYFELGSVQRLTNQLIEAKESFHKALEIVTTDPNIFGDKDFLAEIHLNLGAICYDLGDFNDAAVAYREVIRRCDQNVSLRSDAMLWLAHCYYVTGAYGEARESYLNFLSLSQGSEEQKAEAREGIAKAYYHSADYRQALIEFYKVLPYYPESNPYHYTVLLSFANCFESLGDYEKAQDCFIKVLAAPRASEFDKESARRGIIECRGKLCYESRQYQEAAAAFEEAVLCSRTNDPHHFNLLLWLGNCYEGMGIYSRARHSFEQVLISPYSTEADKVAARKALYGLPPAQKK
jgi:tetratricopeptide (TPR) repeat protein